MDIVQFLLSVINLILALVVLFGGRFFLSKISELQLQIDTLKHALSIKQVTTPKPIQSFLGEEPDGHKARNPEWKV
ncbi:hypothetical protein HQ496_14740 [bacterium]|nr:hypothetical protein [bacterium]